MSSPNKRRHDDSADPLTTLQDTVEAVQATVEKHLAPLLDGSGELARLQAKLRTDKASAAAHVQLQSETVRRSEVHLQDEVKRMGDHVGQVAAVVTLNVGGSKFTTSRSTLTSRSSFLASMFSGRHALQPGGDGSFFIDRDPTHFQALLNYLRCGAITVPKNAERRADLLREVDFYALDDLALELRAPLVQLALGAEIPAERAQELELRAALASGDAQRRKELPPHAGLVNIFGDDGVADSLVYDGGKAAARFPTLLATKALESCPEPQSDKRVAVSSLEAFRQNFSARNANVLQRLEPLLATEPILIAGGAVLHALTKGDTRTGSGAGRQSLWERDEDRCRKSDIDLFVHAGSKVEASRICRAIWYALAVDDEIWVISRGKGVVNLTHQHEEHALRGSGVAVQVVLRLYTSPAEVLLGFDVDCACCGYDGTAVWALPRCLRALKTGINVLNPLHAWPNRATCA